MNKNNINTVAKQFYLEPALVQAVVDVEAAGSGFFTDWNGNQRIKIQFEPHVFKRELKKQGIIASGKRIGKYYFLYVNGLFVLKNKVDNQRIEYKAFNTAFRIHPLAAMLATSWGLGQVMGFNYEVAGYASVGEMITEFRKSELQQLRGMMGFIKNTRLQGVRLIEYLRQHNFERFAYGYNGKYYKRFNYDTRLKKAYDKHK